MSTPDPVPSTPDPVPSTPAPVVAPAPTPSTPKPSEWTVIETDVKADVVKVEAWPTWAKIAAGVVLVVAVLVLISYCA